jgi:hypothetical protein
MKTFAFTRVLSILAANSVFTRCPNAKVVLSSYSQGGQLVHNAMKKLASATEAKLAAVDKPFLSSSPLF